MYSLFTVNRGCAESEEIKKTNLNNVIMFFVASLIIIWTDDNNNKIIGRISNSIKIVFVLNCSIIL